MKNRILLLIDGSGQSFEMVSYISKAYVLWQTEIVLFNVLDIVPDSFWDWEKDPSPQYTAYLKGWEKKKESQIKTAMERAKQMLVNAGARENLIRIKIQKRQAGIARDAILEAKTGYDAVAFGRRGLGGMVEPAIGGVASKLLGSLTNIPLCIVGGKPKIGRIIIGLDNSAGSQRAASFVGKHLSASDPMITLTHVIRNPDRGSPEPGSRAYSPHELVESVQNTILPVFGKVTRSLVNAGLKQNKINHKFITGVSSRAGSLIDEAKHGDAGTLVIGRRGVSDVVQFQMGRVAAKLTQISNHLGLWIVA